jgi:hypothetical protein
MQYAINPPNTPFIDSRGYMRPEWYRFLVQSKAQGDGVTDAGVITTGGDDTVFPNSRTLEVASGELTKTDVAPDLTLGLADAGTAGTDGSATETIAVTRDAKGRVTSVTVYALESGHVVETTNLYYTDGRARAAISGTAPISYNNTTGVISLAASGVTAGTYSPVVSVTVDATGRITAIS